LAENPPQQSAPEPGNLARINLLTSPLGPSISLDVMRRFLGRLLPPFFFAS